MLIGHFLLLALQNIPVCSIPGKPFGRRIRLQARASPRNYHQVASLLKVMANGILPHLTTPSVLPTHSASLSQNTNWTMSSSGLRVKRRYISLQWGKFIFAVTGHMLRFGRCLASMSERWLKISLQPHQPSNNKQFRSGGPINNTNGLWLNFVCCLFWYNHLGRLMYFSC